MDEGGESSPTMELHARVRRRQNDFNLLLGKYEYLAERLRSEYGALVPAEAPPQWAKATKPPQHWMDALHLPAKQAPSPQPCLDPRLVLLKTYEAEGLQDLPSLITLKARAAAADELEHVKAILEEDLDTLCDQYQELLAQMELQQPKEDAAETPPDPVKHDAKAATPSPPRGREAELEAELRLLRARVKELKAEAAAKAAREREGRKSAADRVRVLEEQSHGLRKSLAKSSQLSKMTSEDSEHMAVSAALAASQALRIASLKARLMKAEDSEDSPPAQASASTGMAPTKSSSSSLDKKKSKIPEADKEEPEVVTLSD